MGRRSRRRGVTSEMRREFRLARTARERQAREIAQAVFEACMKRNFGPSPEEPKHNAFLASLEVVCEIASVGVLKNNPALADRNEGGDVVLYLMSLILASVKEFDVPAFDRWKAEVDAEMKAQ